MKKYGFSFSWKRAIGLTAMKQNIARKSGIPTTKNGIQRKVGKIIFDTIFNLIKKK